MIAIMGASATGKTELVKEIQKHNFERIITYTTRPPRDGEDDTSYHFVSDEEFISMKKSGDFAETQDYYTEHGVWRYGSGKIDYLINENSVIILTPSGIRDVEETFADNKKLNMFRVLIVSPYYTRKKRLEERGDDAVEVIRRMRADELDFYDAHKYADLVVHNNGELSIEELARYIIQNYRTWRWKREKSRQN